MFIAAIDPLRGITFQLRGLRSAGSSLPDIQWDALMKLWSTLEERKPERPLHTEAELARLLRTITMNVLRDHFRKLKVEREHLEELALEPVDSDASASPGPDSGVSATVSLLVEVATSSPELAALTFEGELVRRARAASRMRISRASWGLRRSRSERRGWKLARGSACSS